MDVTSGFWILSGHTPSKRRIITSSESDHFSGHLPNKFLHLRRKWVKNHRRFSRVPLCCGPSKTQGDGRRKNRERIRWRLHLSVVGVVRASVVFPQGRARGCGCHVKYATPNPRPACCCVAGFFLLAAIASSCLWCA